MSFNSLNKNNKNNLVDDLLELTDELGCRFDKADVRKFLREFNEEYLYNSILDVRVNKYKLAEIMARDFKGE